MNTTIKPSQWLEEQIQGFRELNADERLAIQNFSLLWSLFEGKILGPGTSSKELIVIAHEGVASGKMGISAYIPCLKYFRKRYFENNVQTANFNQLNLRRNDSPELVEQVLRGNTDDPADVISVILIVIYRFRNNLFHGIKWEYELRDQLDNFNHANEVLMTAYDQLKHR